LYVANNVCSAVEYFRKLGGNVGVAGLVINKDDGTGEAQGFAEAAGIPVLSAIPADDPARRLGLVDWALGFSVYELPIGRFYTHGGNNPGYSSLVLLNRETGWGVVIFTNADQANDMLLAMTATLSGLELDR
ncbi:MAG: hypothetical protein AAFX85_02910, partial [Pseudomonadota bacterium]